MNQKQANDFATLYHFAKTQVSDDEFDMDYVLKGNPKDFAYQNSCGTVGCMVGLMPLVFPSKFGYVGIGDYFDVRPNVVYRLSEYFIEGMFAEFFGVTTNEAHSIVMPNAYYPIGDEWLDPTPVVSKREVLERMASVAGKYGWEL